MYPQKTEKFKNPNWLSPPPKGGLKSKVPQGLIKSSLHSPGRGGGGGGGAGMGFMYYLQQKTFTMENKPVAIAVATQI